jgi:hypothetical protein
VVTVIEYTGIDIVAYIRIPVTRLDKSVTFRIRENDSAKQNLMLLCLDPHSLIYGAVFNGWGI